VVVSYFEDNMKINKIAAFSIVSGFLLLFGLGVSGFWIKKSPSQESSNPVSLVKTASAHEVYPLFECPCCGKPIDQCTCPMAKERMAFVDGLVLGGATEDKAIMAYAKKYGLESFIDKDKLEALKEKLAEEAPADRPMIEVSPDLNDFGDVSQVNGEVSALFELKNQGKSDLLIERLETSCGCTSASIIAQRNEGPRFAMPGHGINEEIGDWQAVLKPGETAQLKVYYDPNVHPEFRGSATRIISVFSNDPIEFEKRVTIELNQVD